MIPVAVKMLHNVIHNSVICNTFLISILKELQEQSEENQSPTNIIRSREGEINAE